MLQEFRIDGFRSLINFTMNLRPGLNVIVGSNGAGKTNFVSFLDFLGELIENDLNAAIAFAQGAGSVFSKEKFQSDRAELEFELCGTLRPRKSEDSIFYMGSSRPDEKGSYRLHTKIIYLKDVPAVLIGEEVLTLDIENQKKLIIRRQTDYLDGKFKSTIHLNPSDHPLLKSMFSWDNEIREERKTLSEVLSSNLSPERSILANLMGQLNAASAVVMDLTGLRSVNIDPSLARKPTPVGVGQDIGSRGEGLAGALYRLNRGSYSLAHNRRFYRRFLPAKQQAAIYKSILSWCREINPDVKGIRVDLDFQEALLRPFISFSIDGQEEVFSLSRISDGTVKWLALLAVLNVETSLTVVEEPENFLHPFMQESFILFCRKLIEDDPIRNIVISTHSPTLLDCCSPNELTLFELKHGISRALKVANAEQLIEKINNSRFGLGYYYRTGGVYGANRSDS